MIADADSARNMIQQLKSNPDDIEPSQEKTFFETCDDLKRPVGLHLSFRDTEYEFAWLVFNSDQPDAKLIGIVYYGRYTLLDGQITLGQNDAISWDEYELKRQEQARIEAELWKKFQAEAEDRDDADIRTIMNNRDNKTIEQLATEFIGKGFRFQHGTEVVLKYTKDYHDFQSVVDAIHRNLLSERS